ncbi:MAG TPA: hypothetical protein VK009_19790 [Chloroflexota bacterium]|nr:hypothetical protein [Chloroflexota bacterium]
MKWIMFGTLAFALLATPATMHAQAAPPQSLGSCTYIQTQRDYFACPSGASAQFVVPANSGVDYTFSYTANIFTAGALQAFSPQLFVTAQLSPSDNSVRNSAGIAFFDTESASAAAVADQYGAMRAGGPRFTATLANNALVDRRDTIQIRYTSGKDGPVIVRFYNSAQVPITFNVDQSGYMIGNHTIGQVTMQLTSGQSAPGCQFVLGFKDLHDLDPADIGDCTENQSFAANGDAQQHTTKGLMAWRKADNWTAFTNGYMTWINGPDGLQSRLNSDRFPWEAP